MDGLAEIDCNTVEPSVHTWGPLGDKRKWPLRSGRYGQVGVYYEIVF